MIIYTNVLLWQFRYFLKLIQHNQQMLCYQLVDYHNYKKYQHYVFPFKFRWQQMYFKQHLDYDQLQQLQHLDDWRLMCMHKLKDY